MSVGRSSKSAEPTPEEIAEKMELPVDRVAVLKITKEPISLETPIGEEEDSQLGDFIEDRNAIHPDAAAMVDLSASVRRVLTLTPRRECFVRLVLARNRITPRRGGARFPSRERIRQIEPRRS